MTDDEKPDSKWIAQPVTHLQAMTIYVPGVFALIGFAMFWHSSGRHDGTASKEQLQVIVSEVISPLRDDVRELRGDVRGLRANLEVRTGDVRIGTNDPPPRPLSTQEMADVLDKSPNTVLKMARRGDLQYYKCKSGNYKFRSPTITDNQQWAAIVQSQADASWIRLLQDDADDYEGNQ